jgi:hypothetical protein
MSRESMVQVLGAVVAAATLLVTVLAVAHLFLWGVRLGRPPPPPLQVGSGQAQLLPRFAGGFYGRFPVA